MNYRVVEQWNDMDFAGSGIVGDIDVTRDQLVAELGEPTLVDGNRILERWLIMFADGMVATIFNEKKKPNQWCVGGFGNYDKKTKENLHLRAVKNLFNLV